jgi:hypothetical protein
MSTYNDIRVRFQMALNEAATTIEGNLLPELDKILKMKGRINSKGGNKDLRYDLGGDTSKASQTISDALKSVGLSDFNVEAIEPSDYKAGSNSGKFYTFVVTFNKAQKVKRIKVAKGQVIKFVDNKPPSGNIKSKELTPSVLGLPEDVEMNANTLKSKVHDSVRKAYQKKDAGLMDILITMYDEVTSYAPKNRFNSPNEVESFSENIVYSNELKDYVSYLSPADLNTIGKDFGEILGAGLMLNMVKTQKGISFPSGNNPLVDFHIDGYGISSKYKSGAAPTLSNIIKDVKEEQFTTDKEKELYNVFKAVESNSVVNGYLKAAEDLNLPGALKAKEITGLSQLTQAGIEEWIQAKLGEMEDREFFSQYIVPLNTYVGRGKTTFDEKSFGKMRKNSRFVGLISYAVTMNLIDKLNGNLGDGTVYLDSLKAIIGKLEVKQLYMDINVKGDEIQFYLKGFSDENAKITFEAPNVSAPNPGNGKLGFKMK